MTKTLIIHKGSTFKFSNGYPDHHNQHRNKGPNQLEEYVPLGNPSQEGEPVIPRRGPSVRTSREEGGEIFRAKRCGKNLLVALNLCMNIYVKYLCDKKKKLRNVYRLR